MAMLNAARALRALQRASFGLDGEGWSFRHAPQRMTEPYRLDGPPDLSTENSTVRDEMDGREPTSNP
jgi:hypothetical protein